MRLRSTLLAVCTLATVIAGCGNSRQSTLTEPGAKGFSLNVWPATFEAGGSASFALDIESAGEITTLVVTAENASSLKATYLDVTYDASQYRPLSATVTDAVAAASGRLELVQLGEPGKIYLGQIAIDPTAAAGLNGDAVVARIELAKGGFTSTRAISAAPVTDHSAPQLTYTAATKTLHWHYAHQGDYDQNSVTTISDLTPMATRIGKPGPFAYESADSVVNGDGNAEINIADITPIGVNFGRRVEKYNIYAGSSTTYPAANDEPSQISPLASVDVAAGGGNPALERRRFEYTLAAPNHLLAYWVRPVDGSSDGTPSNSIAPPPPQQQENNDPVIHTLTATPDTVSSGAASNIVANATDADGDILTYDWTSSDGTLDGSGAAIVLTSPVVGNETVVTVTLILTDSEGGSATDSVQLTVQPEQNLPPVINSVIPTSSTVVSQGSIGITVDASDPDGDLLNFSYASTSGSITGTGPSVTFTAPEVAQEEVVTIEVTVDDGEGNSDSAALEITVTAVAHYAEIENNDSHPQAQVLSGKNFTLAGNVGEGGPNDGDNADYFRLGDYEPGDKLRIVLTHDGAPDAANFELSNEDSSYFEFSDTQVDGSEKVGTFLEVGFQGPYYVIVSGFQGSQNYVLNVEEVSVYEETEDNDVQAQASQLPGFSTDPDFRYWLGTLGELPDGKHYDGDAVDWVKFDFSEGEEIGFDIYIDQNLGTISVEMYDAEGDLLDTGDDLGDQHWVEHEFGPEDASPAAIKIALESGATPYSIFGFLF